MFYEELELKFNIDRLMEDYLNIELNNPPTLNSYASCWETWGIQTNDGNLTLGKSGFTGVSDYDMTIPTVLCTGYIKEVLHTLMDMGFCPCRGRLSKLNAGCSSNFHYDPLYEFKRPHLSNKYAVRMQIPIQTNDLAWYETEEGKVNFKANGSAYLIDVSKKHRVSNDGDTPRTHLMFTVDDTKHVSKYFKFHRNFI